MKWSKKCAALRITSLIRAEYRLSYQTRFIKKYVRPTSAGLLLRSKLTMHIVCDIGGTNMRVAAVSGDSLGEIKKVPTPKDPLEGVAMLAALARECAHGEEVSVLVGGIAADRISESGEVSGATNLRAWEKVNIIRSLSDALGAPVKLVND